ncbi:MAG: glycosyltransferase family 4 protein [Chloroflexota bacterium]
MRLCFVTRLGGLAGPASFQRRLAAGLEALGHQTCYDLDDTPCDAVLVIGGTRRLAALRRARRRGIPIVQRLDGMNWIHRRRRTGVRHFLRAEANNALLRLIRDRLATAVVYQSQFARTWWERAFGPAPVASHVVLNGVPLDRYTPGGPERPAPDRIRLLVVEGNLAGGYEAGLDHAVALTEHLSRLWPQPVELALAGQVPAAVQERLGRQSGALLRWLGLVPAEEIPALDRSAHLLFSADPNPACPNSVIEALACGLPVIAFDTGALPELVTGDAGRLVPYGADPWRLETPDVAALAGAAAEVLRDPSRFRAGARARAEAGLGLETMVRGYLEVLGW